MLRRIAKYVKVDRTFFLNKEMHETAKFDYSLWLCKNKR